MSFQITNNTRESLKLMNDCAKQCDYLEAMENTTEGASLDQIRKLRDELFSIEDRVTRYVGNFNYNRNEFYSVSNQDRRETGKEFLAKLMTCLMNKANNFYKKHTIRISVNLNAGFGKSLYILGLNDEWKNGHVLHIRNTCNWSIRIPKPTRDGCIAFKIVRGDSNNNNVETNHPEWQPTENYIVVPDDEEIKVTIMGEFSDPKSYNFQVTPSNQYFSSSQPNQITNTNRNSLKLMNDCVEQYDYVAFSAIPLSAINSASMEQIKKIWDGLLSIEEGVRRNVGDFNYDRSEFSSISEIDRREIGKEYLGNLMMCLKDKANTFLKRHSTLVMVDYNAGVGKSLYILGLNGDWTNGYKLNIKNSCNWSIRIPKPTRDGCVPFKIVRGDWNDNNVETNHAEWQPGENYLALPEDEKLKININGSFSNPNAYRFRVTQNNQNFSTNQSNQRGDHLSNRDNNSNRVRSQPLEFSEQFLHNFINRNNSPLPNLTNLLADFQPFVHNHSNMVNNLTDFQPFVHNNSRRVNNNVNNIDNRPQVNVDIARTERYSAGYLSENVRNKQAEIIRLIERFEDKETPPAIPGELICPVTQEILSLPVFEATHPGAANNADVRHHLDGSSFEGLFAQAGRYGTVKCPTCRHGALQRANLRVDIEKMDAILQFLRNAVGPN